MVDDRVSRLGKELCMSKGKCQSPMVDSHINDFFSPDLRSTVDI
jgi:hypothetical protein